MLVDMIFFSFSTCLTRFSTYKLVDDNTVDGKVNKEKKTRGCITSVGIIGLLLLLAGVLLLLFQLDDGVFFLLIQLYDVMSPGFVSPALLEELLSEGIYHDVTNLDTLLHLNVLAIHSVVNHQYN